MDTNKQGIAEKPAVIVIGPEDRKPARDDQSRRRSSQQPSQGRRRASKFVRWIFLFVLFIYLLALAMTLFEIDAFQTLVAQLGASSTDQGTAAGNSRQREILQAVRITSAQSGGGASPQARPDQSKIPEAERQLYLQVAAKIDPLRVAINALGDIGAGASFELRADETYKRAQRDAFRELAGRIGRAVDDVQQKVKDLPTCGPEDSDAGGGESPRCIQVPSKDLAVDLGALQRAIEGLRGYIDYEKQDPDVQENPEAADRQQRKAGEQIMDVVLEMHRLAQRLEDPKNRQKVDALIGNTGKMVDKLVKDTNEALERLEALGPDNVMDLKSASFAEAETAGEAAGVARAGSEGGGEAAKLTTIDRALGTGERVVALRRILSVYGKFKGKEQLYNVEFPKSKDEAGSLDDELKKIVRQFQRDNGGAVDGIVGPNTRLSLNAFVAECNVNPKCINIGVAVEQGQAKGRSVDISDEIERLRTALGKIKASITPYLGDYKRIGNLTQQLANIEVASRRLAHLEVNVEDNPFAGATAGDSLEEARRIYQAETLALATAIKQMRRTLGQADAAIPIADAIGDQDPLAHKKAVTILREFQALERYGDILRPLSFLEQPPCPPSSHSSCWYTFRNFVNRLAEIGFRPKDMATMTRQALDIMVVLVMGAIGSLIYLIKYLLSQLLLRSEEGCALVRPLSWYLFRPLFGIVVAFAIYLLYKTGQVALGGGSASRLSSDVNLPILSIFSLFAGLLSWQALEMVESKGRRWLSAQHRENLWASGLATALRHAGKTINDCASQVGVTPNQVDRWIAGQDRVTPEMQDRITAWLNRDRDEVFGDTNPRDIDEGNLRWATGLKGALKVNKAGIDVPRLAQRVGQDVATVHAWVELKRQVDREMQFLISEKLGEPRHKLFTEERPGAEYWAVGLRAALHKGSEGLRTADDLARAIGSTPQNVRRYMELKASVPQPVQNLMVETLALDQGSLFSADLPLDAEFKWAAKLRECLRKSALRDCAKLAETIDTEAMWVRGWMEQEVCGEEGVPYCGQVAPGTQPILAAALGCTPETLFRSERAAGDFKWAVMPRFEELIDAPARGGIGELARRLDLDVPRIERWISYSEPVAPETQLALLADLGLPVEERESLFTSRPPVDPEGPEGVWWATGLRAAVRDHPDYRGLGDLAAQLEIPVQTLFDQVEMLAPVPMDQRDRITRLLGLASPRNGPLFTNQGPDWTDFCWAPRLRVELERAGMDASELAGRLDVNVKRVRDWMEMDDSDVEPRWAKGEVKRGQICPTTCEAIVRILGGESTSNLFAKTRTDAGARYAIKPTFGLALDAFDGRLAGFAEQVDADPARVGLWVDQKEPVAPATKDRILDVLGLDAGHEGQVFSPEPKEEDAQG